MKTFVQFIAEQVLYHGTPRTNLESILANGLVPYVGKNKADAEESPQPAVHFTISKEIAQNYAGESGVVLTVDTSHPDLKSINFTDDPHEEKSVLTFDPIPPSAIIP